MPNNSQDAVFCERAGSPCLPPRCREPLVRPIMLDMSRVDQRDQDIDIEQEPCQGNSSRN